MVNKSKENEPEIKGCNVGIQKKHRRDTKRHSSSQNGIVIKGCGLVINT
jgi:hypothetical protein